jgi:hypothetical protein
MMRYEGLGRGLDEISCSMGDKGEGGQDWVEGGDGREKRGATTRRSLNLDYARHAQNGKVLGGALIPACNGNPLWHKLGILQLFACQ